MALPTDRGLRHPVQLALFIALALVLFLFDSFFPKPVPFFRVGLANSMVLTVLVLYGARDGAVVALGKVLLGALFTGTLFNFIFFLSAAATVCSLLVMIAGVRWLRGIHSIIGISIWSAAAHNAAQLLFLCLFLPDGFTAGPLIPWFAVSAVLSGGVVGVIAYKIINNNYIRLYI